MGRWEERRGTKIESNFTREIYYSKAFLGWFFWRSVVSHSHSGLQDYLNQPGSTVYRMLCVLLGQGPWKGCRAGVIFKGEQCRSPPTCCYLPLHPGLTSDSGPLVPFRSSRYGNTAFFWKFLSHGPFKHGSDNASDTENRPEKLL